MCVGRTWLCLSECKSKSANKQKRLDVEAGIEECLSRTEWAAKPGLQSAGGRRPLVSKTRTHCTQMEAEHSVRVDMTGQGRTVLRGPCVGGGVVGWER